MRLDVDFIAYVLSNLVAYTMYAAFRLIVCVLSFGVHISVIVIVADLHSNIDIVFISSNIPVPHYGIVCCYDIFPLLLILVIAIILLLLLFLVLLLVAR